MRPENNMKVHAVTYMRFGIVMHEVHIKAGFARNGLMPCDHAPRHSVQQTQVENEGKLSSTEMT